MIKRKLKQICKSAVSSCGFEIKRLGRNGRYKSNVFDTDYRRHALVSIHHVSKDHLKDYCHTAQAEAWLIAEVIDDLEFKVDICSYEEELPLDQLATYDLVFGYGESVDHLLKSDLDDRPLVVSYTTGSHLGWNYNQTARRLKQAHKEKGVVFRNSHRQPDFWRVAPYLYPDALVVTGNDFVARTYESYTMSPIFPVTLVGFKTVKLDLRRKDYNACRSQFMWFGGRGFVHKGLDIVLDYFLEQDDLELHIGGELEKEPDFYDYYLPKIAASAKVHYHGFLDLDSDIFAELMHEVGFIIVPSCSEGLCGSVVNPMINGGLIPIVTPNTGVDIEGFGIPVDGFEVADIGRAVNEATELSLREMKERTMYILNEVATRYTPERFRQEVRSAILEFLEQDKSKIWEDLSKVENADPEFYHDTTR